MGSTGECSFLGVADAQDCGVVRITVPRSGLEYFGEFGGYAIPTEQSD